MQGDMDAGMDASTLDAAEGRWMTYAELAEARHIDKPSALKQALRHPSWPRRKNNAGQMQVCVPLDWAEPKDRYTPPSIDPSTDLSRGISAFETGLAAFQEQAEAERARADRAEQALAGERARADQLRERIEVAGAAEDAARKQAREALDALAGLERGHPAAFWERGAPGASPWPPRRAATGREWAMAGNDLDLRLDLSRTAARLRDCARLLELGTPPAQVAQMLRDLAGDVARLRPSLPEGEGS